MSDGMTYEETKALIARARAKMGDGLEPETEAVELLFGTALNIARIADALARAELIRDEERLAGG